MQEELSAEEGLDATPIAFTLSSLEQNTTQKLKNTVPGYILDPPKSYADWIVNQELFVELRRRTTCSPRPETAQFSLNKDLVNVYRSLLPPMDGFSQALLISKPARPTLDCCAAIVSTAFAYSVICAHVASTPWPRLALPNELEKVNKHAGGSTTALSAVNRSSFKRSITKLEQTITLAKDMNSRLEQLHQRLDEIMLDLSKIRSVSYIHDHFRPIVTSIQHHRVRLSGLYDILVLASEQVVGLLNALAEDHTAPSTSVIYPAYAQYQRSVGSTSKVCNLIQSDF